MPFVWSLLVRNDTQAICMRDGVLLHTIAISDQALDEHEAYVLAKTLIKMKAMKDVLNPEWSDFDAAQYAVANRVWLDNKFLDSARKRWGSAHYLMEKWLLLGAYKINANVNDLAMELDVTIPLKNLIHTLNAGELANAFNAIALQSPKLGTTHGLFVDNQYCTVQGVWLHEHQTDAYGIAMVLSEEGVWHILMVDTLQPYRAEILSQQEPPTAHQLQYFFPNVSIATLENALALN